MATRNSSGVARRRVRLDGNRPRTHPKCHHRMAAKPRLAAVGGYDWCDHGAVDRALHGATT
jgi:hypothetical protein